MSREEFEEPAEGPCAFDEDMMGPPEELGHDVPQAHPDQEPTALAQAEMCKSMKVASEEPTAPAELPILDAWKSTPKRKADPEPTAQVVSPLVAAKRPKQKKLRRLAKKTTVPHHVCLTRSSPKEVGSGKVESGGGLHVTRLIPQAKRETWVELGV